MIHERPVSYPVNMPVVLQNALGVLVGMLPLCGVIFWAAFQQGQRLSRLETQLDMLTARTNSQFDTLTARMNSQFDALAARMNSQFDALAARMNSQFDALEAKIDKLISQSAEQNTRIAIIENKIDGARLVEAR